MNMCFACGLLGASNNACVQSTSLKPVYFKPSTQLLQAGRQAGSDNLEQLLMCQSWQGANNHTQKPAQETPPLICSQYRLTRCAPFHTSEGWCS